MVIGKRVYNGENLISPIIYRSKSCVWLNRKETNMDMPKENKCSENIINNNNNWCLLHHKRQSSYSEKRIRKMTFNIVVYINSELLRNAKT